MKTTTIFKNLIALAILMSSTFVFAQDRNEDQLFDLGTSDLRTINGTTTYDGGSAGTIGFGGSYFGYFSASVIAADANYNAMIGAYSGFQTTNGDNNSFLGTGAGYRNTTGSSNVAVGFVAGYSNQTGIANVFLGNFAGFSETGSNTLYIDNSSAATPLIYGDFSSDKVGINTKNLVNSVGGANTSAYSLYVEGGILTEELRVRTGWADYVFESDYQLPSLTEVETYIAVNGHLPNIPSAEQVAAQGIELGDMARLQQEKIEELTLYVIQQQKEIEELKTQMGLLLQQR